MCQQLKPAAVDNLERNTSNLSSVRLPLNCSTALLLTIDQRFNICRHNLLQVVCDLFNVPIPPSHLK